jgi:hypothetical protein
MAKVTSSGSANKADQRRSTQISIINKEIDRVSYKLVHNEGHKPREPGDGCYVDVADRDEDLVLLAILRKLREVRDAILYNGALS